MNKRQRIIRYAIHALTAMVLLGCVGAPVKPTWDLPPDVKTFPANGYPMAYTERGAGPTVVFVHGAVSDYRTFSGQMEPLSAKLRVIAVSLRHYYPERWSGQGNDFSETQHAKDLAAFIEQLGAGPVYLVAISRGGVVSILMTQSRPDLVRKLVLMEPALKALHATGMEDPRVGRWRETVRLYETQGVDAGLEYFVDDVGGTGTWKALPEDRRRANRDNAWTIAGQLKDSSVITCADVAGLKVPTLLLGGEKTTADNRIDLDEAHKCMPFAKRATIPNAGHFMHRQNSAAFHETLLQFLFS
jgi:pimeloyl-ACP methyl ester carboxylesterase